MKLGEIMIESLRLMNVNDENLTISNIDEKRQDDRYKDYLDRMHGAINRALTRYATYKLIPTKVAEVKPSQGETIKQFLRLNLKKILPDFESLERVIYIYERVVPNIDFQTITDGVILIPFSSSYLYKGEIDVLPKNPIVGTAYNLKGECKAWNGEEWVEIIEDEIFNIEYTPKLEMITATTDNEKEIDIPETLARIIPYFVKADLFEMDEPELSATARNIFESALSEYVSFGVSRKQRQQYVKNTMF
jgi:hypothetical protein